MWTNRTAKLVATACATIVLAVHFVTAAPHLHPQEPRQAVDIIQDIMPTSFTCTSATDECRRAQEAAPFLIAAFQRYGCRSYGEMAGMLAVIGYESVDMKHKHNVSPGRPGQGTANMQMLKYNVMYAISLLGADKVTGLGPNEVLALVTPDQFNFGSAPWFLTTQCEPSVRAELQQGTNAGFAAYMGCIGLGVTDDRNAYFGLVWYF